MTKEEAIKDWAEYIIPAVFTAENKLRDKLKQIIADNKDDKERAAKLYSRAIAEEIVSTPDSENLVGSTDKPIF